MKVVYQSTFTTVGSCAPEALSESFLITFAEGAPEELAAFCFIHRNAVNQPQLMQVGDVLTIGALRYPITAIGRVARDNLQQLGHITVRFDGAAEAEFPGSLHVQGRAPDAVEIGQQFSILSE